jgi:hypothetical protein
MSDPATRLEYFHKGAMDWNFLLSIVTSVVLVALSYSRLQTLNETLGDKIAVLERDFREVNGIRERALVLETRFGNIDERLARIETLLDGLARQRAALEPVPSSPRTTRR